MLICGNLGPLDEHLARHHQVKNQRPAAFALHKDHLSPALQARDLCAFKGSQSSPGNSSQERRKKKAEYPQLGPFEVRPEAADDRLDLGELGHGAIVPERLEK